MALYKYPLNVGETGSEFPHSIHFSARRHLKDSPNESASVSEGDVILYLPADALKTSYSQSFNDTDLGAAGMAGIGAEDAAGLVRSITNTVTSGANLDLGDAFSEVGGVVSTAINAIGNANLKAAIAQSAVNEGFRNLQGPLGTARDAILRKAGRIINPHKAVIYQGPGGFRVFNFSFSMSPENISEARVIAKIVHYFKYYMHPGVPSTSYQSGPGGPTAVRRSTGGNINSSITLSYPEEFKITARVKNVTDPGTTGTPGSESVKPLFKIDNCFLESLSVDYSTSGGPAFIVDGITAPATTSLTLQFKETVLMTKEKIEEGY